MYVTSGPKISVCYLYAGMMGDTKGSMCLKRGIIQNWQGEGDGRLTGQDMIGRFLKSTWCTGHVISKGYWYMPASMFPFVCNASHSEINVPWARVFQQNCYLHEGGHIYQSSIPNKLYLQLLIKAQLRGLNKCYQLLWKHRQEGQRFGVSHWFANLQIELLRNWRSLPVQVSCYSNF